MPEHAQSIALDNEIQTQVEYIPPQSGKLVATSGAYPTPSGSRPQAQETQISQQPAAKGLIQTFGLHVTSAVLTIIVDMMLFGGEIVSVGLLIPLGIACGLVLGFIVYRIQRHWYGDDQNSALIKAMIVGLLTAIPTSVTPVIAAPAGVLGIVNMVRRRNPPPLPERKK